MFLRMQDDVLFQARVKNNKKNVQPQLQNLDVLKKKTK